ncbi:MAG TPA: V-type ATPase 116kDa subunit family protein [Gammaproteobacteria bacterium]|nr:V-type ATPase 116kDa subunit family protein [Gammaproteobacteria bacterium]
MPARNGSLRWFEVLVPRAALARAAELLAAPGEVELDRAPAAGGLDTEALRALLDEHQRLRRDYAGHWPESRVARTGDTRQPERLGTAAVDCLRQWEGRAAPLVHELETLDREREALTLLRDFLALAGEEPGLDIGRLARGGEAATARLLVLPPDAPTPELAERVLRLRVDGPDHAFLLLLGPRQDVLAVAGEAALPQGRLIELPLWLQGDQPRALAALEERLAALRGQADRLRDSIRGIGEALGLAEALGHVRRLEWMTEHLGGACLGEYLARIDGWTSAPDPDTLAAPLRRAGIPAVAGFVPPPAGREPPTLTRNPAWARPFELFVRLMGTPGQGETDPSRLLAVIAPLLFGYMFGDLGQGAVLLLAGLVLRRRWPALAMLIPGGLAAMLFGLAFGSVFAREGLVGPLWVNPLVAPLPVLAVPLVGGAALMLLGLLLNALAAWQTGRGGDWLRVQAGLVLAYGGAVAAFVAPLFGIAAAGLGALWYLAGSASQWRELGTAGVLGRAGELLERLFQLLVNTVSFVRVGAFALAHAGLSMAVTGLALAAPHGVIEYTILAVGNAAILAIEGLVVGIQTTRLILFEFFIRFLQAGGRPFRPSLPPT